MNIYIYIYIYIYILFYLLYYFIFNFLILLLLVILFYILYFIFFIYFLFLKQHYLPGRNWVLTSTKDLTRLGVDSGEKSSSGHGESIPEASASS